MRLHVPAKIQFHNAPSKQVERGNIVSWEQPLKDRLAGQPLRVEVRMERNSILAWTLTIFGASAAAAAVLFVLVIWWVRRKGVSAADCTHQPPRRQPARPASAEQRRGSSALRSLRELPPTTVVKRKGRQVAA